MNNYFNSRHSFQFHKIAFNHRRHEGRGCKGMFQEKYLIGENLSSIIGIFFIVTHSIRLHEIQKNGKKKKCTLAEIFPSENHTGLLLCILQQDALFNICKMFLKRTRKLVRTSSVYNSSGPMTNSFKFPPTPKPGSYQLVLSQ